MSARLDDAQQRFVAMLVGSMTHRQLAELLRKLGGGRIGLDAARASKEQLAAHAVANYPQEAVNAAIAVIGDPTTYVIEPPASASSQPLPPNTTAFAADATLPANPVTAAVERGEIKRATIIEPDPFAKIVPTIDTSSAAQRLADALRDLGIGTSAAPAAPLDETRVGEIADKAAAVHTAALAAAFHDHLAERFTTFEGMLASAASKALSAEPRVLDVRSITMPEGVRVTGQHPLFEKTLRLVSAGVNVLLVGPAGCGKTHLAEQVATALGRPFGALSLTAGTTESALTGRLLPGDGGKFSYYESPFVRIYESGGVFLFDELDAADPNMLLIVNSALANAHIEIEQRAVSGLPTRLDRHAGCALLGAANTFGTGASAQYVGRGALDAATVDRWYVVEMSYDAAFEASLFGGLVSPATPWAAAATNPAHVTSDVTALGEWVISLRASAAAAGLRRVVSSRMIQKAAAARRAGVFVDEIKRDLLAGWSDDERRSAGVLA